MVLNNGLKTLCLRCFHLQSDCYIILNANNNVKLSSPAIAKMPSARQEEYLAINESYHQAAILHVYQRVHGVSSSVDQIQKIVRRILSLVSRVGFHDGPCPVVMLFFPVFSAGCSAINAVDQQKLRTILQKLADSIGFCYIRRSIQILDALWSSKADNTIVEKDNCWEKFIGEIFLRP